MITAHQPTRQQRVAIAGTVVNGATQEGLPQVVVRITQAPVDCIESFLTILDEALRPYPHLRTSYQRLMHGRPITPATLKLAQALFHTFEHHQWLRAPRPDQTLTGGDGHYCFFDLPPGDYGLTATLSIPQVCQGATQGRVRVHPSDRWLAFSDLDLTLAVQPFPQASAPLPWRSWSGPEAHPSTVAALFHPA